MLPVMVLRRWFVIGLSLALLLAVLAPATPASAGWHSLTGKLPAPTLLQEVVFSPDSKYVVYAAAVGNENSFALYSVPVTGTKPIPLSPPMAEGGSVHSFRIAPNSQFVVYIANQDDPARLELYRVPLGGGQPQGPQDPQQPRLLFLPALRR